MAYRFSILLALNRGTTELTAGTLNLRGGPQPRIHVDVVKGDPKYVMTPEAPELGTLYYSVVAWSLQLNISDYCFLKPTV